MRLVDEDDREVPDGEVGEVVVDGPTVMAGYLDMPEATRRALRGGWLHTGDLGRFDARGRLTLVDRAKDVVITGGYNVYPREVEDVLLAEPAVAEAAVVGVPDREWGERVVAYRRRRSARRRSTPPRSTAAASTPSPATSGRRSTSLVAELPRNAAGKVLKQRLRERTPRPATEEAPMTHVELLDETIRDGQQSLWGMRMQAGMALPVADALDRTGFKVIDAAASSFMEVLVKYCREDPWEGLDLLRGGDPPHADARRHARQRRRLVRGDAADALMDLWMRRLNEHGVRSFWIYDVLYGVDNFARLARIAKEYGSEVVGTVFYSQSPVHTDDYLAAKAAEIAAVPEIDGVLFYDTAGVLDIDRLRALVPRIVAAARRQAGRVPLEQPHGHVRPRVRRGGPARHPRAAHREPPDGQRAVRPVDGERRAQPRADGLHARDRQGAAGAGRRALPPRRAGGGLPRRPGQRVRPLQRHPPGPGRDARHAARAARPARDGATGSTRCSRRRARSGASSAGR